MMFKLQERNSNRYELSVVLLLFLFLVLYSKVEAFDQVVLRDSLNREVKIPGKVDRIVCLQPELLRILVALGQQEKVVAVDRFPVKYDHLLRIIFPEIVYLPVVSVTGEDANVEKILSLRPDLVLVSPSELFLTRQLSRKLRCPVVSLSATGRLDRLLDEIEVLGRLTGSRNRSEELKRFLQDKISWLQNQVTRVAASRKPRVYLSFWGSILRSPVFYEPVEVAGGFNLTSKLRPIHQGSDTAVLTIEKILSWDPEIILVHGNYPPEERKLTVEQVKSDPRLQSIQAVRAHRVHYTFGFWYWWDPALVLVECYYLSQLFHPGLKNEFDLKVEAEAIFKFFYGKEGLFQTLCDRIKAHDWFRAD